MHVDPMIAAEELKVVRIFVVDDNPMVRAALKAALHRHSDWVVVGEAVDGQHALETFHHHMPHLTLMDFIMPRMNGLEVARHLKQRHPDVLILLVTTEPSKQLEREARRVGIKGLCLKSEMSCLWSAVEEIINGGTYFPENALSA